jgi:hypothetical protein
MGVMRMRPRDVQNAADQARTMLVTVVIVPVTAVALSGS